MNTTSHAYREISEQNAREPAIKVFENTAENVNTFLEYGNAFYT